jgi:hypothetical protein
MIKSIQQFEAKGVKKLNKFIEKFIESPTNHAEFVSGVTEVVLQLGLDILSETFGDMDECLRDSGLRKRHWHIVKRDETTLLTSLGNITYKKTLFQQKETKERCYLSDRMMGLSPHTRMTEDAEEKLLEEAVESSYRKGGFMTSMTDHVSKQTAKNKIHALRFEEEEELIEKKKQVRILHINADEDHVSAQFWEKKGDLERLENANKINTLTPKLVYLYEDIISENEDGNGKRHKLLNPYYFGGLREGKKNRVLWEEVQRYIEVHYDTEYLEKVYLCGDGAAWIKAGCEYVDKSIFVLDRFHLQKYINQSVAHLAEGQEETKDAIFDCLSYEDQKGIRKIYRKLSEKAETEWKRIKLEKSRNYLLNNWKAIMIYHSSGKEILGCSAEGHVSHVYSSRMSSRPMGWSRIGADKMAQLRIYYYNKGNLLDLVRKQKEPVKEVETEIVYSCQEILTSERNKHGNVGKYVEKISRTLASLK